MSLKDTFLGTFGDLDKEHWGEGDPDFSSILMPQEIRRILFYL
jgi:hypothetical protein